MNKQIKIKIDDLLLDSENRRLAGEDLADQQEILDALFEDSHTKLSGLIEDIVSKRGIHPGKRCIVTQAEDSDKYVVLEGNRRLAALKYLKGYPEYKERYEAYLKPSSDLEGFWKKNPVPALECVVFESREAAWPWIELEHNGELDGAGIVQWDPVWRNSFSTALMDELGLSRREFLGVSTNMDRFFRGSQVKEHLGIDYSPSKEKLLKIPEAKEEREAIVLVMRTLLDVGVDAIRTPADRQRFLDQEIKVRLGVEKARTSKAITEPTPADLPGERKGAGRKRSIPLPNLADSELDKLLINIKNGYKLAYLDNSLHGIKPVKHTLLLYIGLGALVEVAVAKHIHSLGRKEARYPKYINRLLYSPEVGKNWRSLTGKRKDTIDAAIKRINQRSNAAKHDPDWGVFSRVDLVTDYGAAAPVIRALLQDVADKEAEEKAKNAYG